MESSVDLMTLLQKNHIGVVEEAVVSLTTPLWLMAFLQTILKELTLLESSVGLMTLLQQDHSGVVEEEVVSLTTPLWFLQSIVKDHSGVVEEAVVSLTTPLWLMAFLQTIVNNPG